MEQPKLTINVVVWAENFDLAKEIALSLTQGTEEKGGVYKGEVEGHTVLAYIRYPGIVVSSSPKGITDVLVVKLSGATSEFLEEAKKYVNFRKSIPFKYFTGSDDLEPIAKEFEAEYCAETCLFSDCCRKKVISEVTGLEETLRAAFNKIDLNGNGFITADELMSISESLQHPLKSEDAKEIANAISPDGNIPYDKFKAWWVQRKSDLIKFRTLVKAQMRMSKFFHKGSKVINSYFEKMEKESTLETGDTTGKFDLDISPSADFESGISLGLDVACGTNFNAVVNDLPNYFKTNPLTFSLDLNLNSPDMAPLTVQTFESLLPMVLEIPDVKAVIESGWEIHFRSCGSVVSIDITLGGILGEMLLAEICPIDLNLDSINYSGDLSLRIANGLKPPCVLKCELDQIIAKACHLAIQSSSSISNAKLLVNPVVQLLGECQCCDQVKEIGLFLRALTIIRKVSHQFKYDVNTLVSFIQDTLPVYMGVPKEMIFGMAAEQLAALQQMVPANIDPIKPMIIGYLDAFGLKPLIEALNFDRISVSGSLSCYKIFGKVSVNLSGVTAYVAENILA